MEHEFGWFKIVPYSSSAFVFLWVYFSLSAYSPCLCPSHLISSYTVFSFLYLVPKKCHSISMWFPCMWNIRWPNSPPLSWLSLETRLQRIRSECSFAQIHRKLDYPNLSHCGYADLIRHSHAKNCKLDSLVPFMNLSSTVSTREKSVSINLDVSVPQRIMSNVTINGP